MAKNAQDTDSQFMSSESDGGLTRRQAVVAGLAGATTIAGLGREVIAKPKEPSMNPSNNSKLPVAYLPHGGGPWPFVEMGLDRREVSELATYLRSVKSLPKSTVKALLVISAHWEERRLTVMSGSQPPMFYDYYGFPPESYKLTWPAPGAPELAKRVQACLESRGFETDSNPERGFDHGTFVPLKLTYPEANVPTIQLSLRKGLDPAEHLAIGRALAPLRDEGVFIVGSGMSYHNMRGFGDPGAQGAAEAFDQWLRESVTLEASERDRRLSKWVEAPAARACHPREEHLLPLMVIAGAAGTDVGRLGFSGTMFGMKLSAFHFG